MNVNEHIAYWITGAEHDYESAESLFNAGKYDWCLFICHIVIEKALRLPLLKPIIICFLPKYITL